MIKYDRQARHILPYCPEETRIERMIAAGDRSDQTMLDHETERYVDKFDVDGEIDNSGEWRATVKQIESIMKELEAKQNEND